MTQAHQATRANQAKAHEASGSDDVHLGRLPLTRRLMLMAMLLASAAGGFMLLKLLGLPVLPGLSPLLTGQGLVALVASVVVASVFGLIGLFVLGWVRPDAGLLSAAASLVTLRLQSGPMRIAYVADPSSATLIAAAIELAILSIPFVVIGALSWWLVSKGTLPSDDTLDLLKLDTETPGQKLLASFVAFMTMAFLLMILLTSDHPRQAAISILLASAAGSAIAFRFIPAVTSLWLWPVPIVGGLVAYVWSAVSSPGNIAIGEPGGYFGQLARAAPLDFASAGVLGAIWGYYIGRAWTGGSKQVQGG